MITAANWLSAVESARSEGYAFDWLGCVDEIGQRDCLRVVLSLRHLDRPAEPELLLGVDVGRDASELDSLRSVYAGAAWHEREAAELFGVSFAGGDHRRLLLAPEFEGVPLRKDEVVAGRAGVPWPGAKEPGESDASPSRRRMVPPGVPDPAVWGDRDPGAPSAQPAEVAESAVGGRVRRRPR
ncbi:MAG TPA: NADH-quinone oxidoreductase subunit C [Microlunatus sp.]